MSHASSISAERLPNKWQEDRALPLSEPELLLYRSNLLGSDLRITNYGGGNTSAKVRLADPLTGELVDVLWVKGSGGDIGSMKLDGFATLYLDRLEALRRRYRGHAHEDEMVDLFAHCTFNLNPRATSIDTPLHCYIPFRHVDHMHADAIIAVAASRNGERVTREIFGAEVGWVPWQRPGFDLGLQVERLVKGHPGMNGLVMGSHGLINWADESKACYETTLRLVQQAADWLNAKSRLEPFGPVVTPPLDETKRRTLLAAIAPALRGLLSAETSKVLHYLDTPDVLTFVGAARAEELAMKGTTCPDHFLRTKVKPLFVPFAPEQETAEDLLKKLPALIEHYRTDYAAYYERCKRANSPKMRDPYPILLLVPGLGLLSFQKDKATARVAAEYYVNTINVMRWAEGVDEYVPIAEQDAFDIEYWVLEEAKLQRLPKPKRLEGRVALVTGGAGGIGSATARRLLDDGACVVLTDIDASALEETATALGAVYGKDRVRVYQADATNEEAVQASLAFAAREFGGLDILVANAGIASAAPIDETPLPLWNRTMDILATGYFLAAREAFRTMRKQARGGAIVFVGSKNALVASPGASAYGTAKAAAVHLARSIAVEGAPFGIRVNVVNPDAVIQGSRIWGGSWRAERAASNRIAEADVEEFYRQRSLLKRSVFPEDIAEAIVFLASDASAKSTGNILNVDAGNAGAFTR